MKCNVGSTDRILQVVLGIAILGVGYVLPSYWGLVGLVPLLTGIFRFCPLSILVGINTHKRL
jgi:hypothetical protein